MTKVGAGEGRRSNQSSYRPFYDGVEPARGELWLGTAFLCLLAATVAHGQDSDVDHLLDSVDPAAAPSDLMQDALLRRMMLLEDGGVAVARRYLANGKTRLGRLMACVVLEANRDVRTFQRYVQDQDNLVRTFASVVAAKYPMPDRDDAPPLELSMDPAHVERLEPLFAGVAMSDDEERQWVVGLARRYSTSPTATQYYVLDAVLDRPAALVSVVSDILTDPHAPAQQRETIAKAFDLICRSTFDDVPSDNESLRSEFYTRLKPYLEKEAASSSAEERSWAIQAQMFLMDAGELCRALPALLADPNEEVKWGAQNRSVEVLQFLSSWGRRTEFDDLAPRLEAAVAGAPKHYREWIRRNLEESRQRLAERERLTRDGEEGRSYLCVNGKPTRVSQKEYAACVARFGTPFVTEGQRELVRERLPSCPDSDTQIAQRQPMRLNPKPVHEGPKAYKQPVPIVCRRTTTIGLTVLGAVGLVLILTFRALGKRA